IPNPSKSNEEHDEEEEEYDDEFNVEEGEKMEEEEDDEVTKELYKDVNVNLRNKDADMTDASQELVDSTVRSIIKEEVNIQLPQILPQAISDVATPVIEKNVIKSLKSDVLTRSSSQPQSSDIFKSYGEVFSLKRSRYERDKYRDLSAGSNRGTKRRKSSKDADKSCYAKEPSHTVEDSGMQQDQEFITEDNEEQPADKEVTKADWLKKPERPLTLNPDWKGVSGAGETLSTTTLAISTASVQPVLLKWFENQEAKIGMRKFFKCWVHHHATNGHQFTMSNRHQELASPKANSFCKDLASLKQTALGKDILNPLLADSLPKTIWLSVHHVIAMKHW
nr:hypothetical protein [Tanacetum cinerariifolium]